MTEPTSDITPSIESHLRQHLPRPDLQFPHYGRDASDHSHAVYSIIGHLAALGLTDWVPRLTMWLSRYDGLELYAEDEEDPHLCVRQVLANHCARVLDQGKQNETLKAQIVEDLLQLTFVRYRAHWGTDLAADACVFR
ncbi:hypothetical protein ACFIQG_20280 [Comamonas odontotermitis]|uniref:hypothetical protein n=1 Tax=Comamonas odontotermitis TaxID=379895 RepID=UPI00366D8AF5